MNSGRPIDLLSPAGKAALREAAGPEALFAFDLDGTLAPIVPDHAEVSIPEDVQRRMSRLCTLATVAIVTGRSRSDAMRLLRFEPRFLLGNHGAEGLPGEAEQEKRFVVLCRGWEEQLRAILPMDRLPYLLIENKGPTLTVHYRRAPAPPAAQREIVRAVRKLTPPPHCVGGKFVENLMPAEAADKGEAIVRLMKLTGMARAIFVGDDLTDEAVFRLGGNRIFGVRIGRDHGSDAGYFIEEQQQIVEVLEVMVASLANPR